MSSNTFLTLVFFIRLIPAYHLHLALRRTNRP